MTPKADKSASERPHISVLCREVIEALQPKAGATYVDGTFGAGGHSRSILEAAPCQLIAIDQDPNAEFYANRLEERYADRFRFIPGRFGDMDRLIADKVGLMQGVLLDIGVSSMQLDEAERGFSFMQDGPLDMRMSGQGQTAAEWVNEAEERDLADTLYTLGGEKKSRRIARAIVEARQQEPFTRTRQLARLIEKAAPAYKDTIHPATRSFQAIRILINDELNQLHKGLEAAEKLLAPGGRLAIITFHSGEDELVKRFLEQRSGKKEAVSRHMPLPVNDNEQPTFVKVSRKPIIPSEQEVRDNPRARSAKLRVAERTTAPIHSQRGDTR